MDTSLQGMTCPNCGSDDWKKPSRASYFLGALLCLSFGLIFALILIGIPLLIAGVVFFLAGVFGRDSFVCSRCQHAWTLGT